MLDAARALLLSLSTFYAARLHRFYSASLRHDSTFKSAQVLRQQPVAPVTRSCHARALFFGVLCVCVCVRARVLGHCLRLSSALACRDLGLHWPLLLSHPLPQLHPVTPHPSSPPNLNRFCTTYRKHSQCSPAAVAPRFLNFLPDPPRKCAARALMWRSSGSLLCRTACHDTDWAGQTAAANPATN